MDAPSAPRRMNEKLWRYPTFRPNLGQNQTHPCTQVTRTHAEERATATRLAVACLPAASPLATAAPQAFPPWWAPISPSAAANAAPPAPQVAAGIEGSPLPQTVLSWGLLLATAAKGNHLVVLLWQGLLEVRDDEWGPDVIGRGRWLVRPKALMLTLSSRGYGRNQ